jgi:5-methylcytosine-specific restriction protein A
MPKAPPRACRSGCPHFQPCPDHSRKPWAARRGISRQQRGYDAKHEALRRQVLREEPICRRCGFRLSVIADHIVALSLGGKTVRGNLQALCERCSRSKTGVEGAYARSGLASRLQARPKGDGPGSPVSRQARDFLPIPPGAT